MENELEKVVEAIKRRRTTVEQLITDVEAMLAEPRIEDVFQRPFLARVRNTLDKLRNYRFSGSSAPTKMPDDPKILAGLLRVMAKGSTYPLAPSYRKLTERAADQLEQLADLTERAKDNRLGPCKTFLPGADSSRCVYCDHMVECHHAVTS